MKSRFNKVTMGLAAAMTIGVAQPGIAEEPVKIALIEALSGGMAQFGEAAHRSFSFDSEMLAAKGGQAFEIVPFDNQLNPKEALVQLQNAIDKGIRYIAQGNGSSIAHALLGGIAKHNKRNPGKEVIFLNYAAVDPALTNEKCSYWHFRFDAHVDVKMSAMVGAIKQDESIRKVYLIDQDYSYGHAVAKSAREMLAVERPDIEIVGDVYHPIARVKDFSPYITKIAASDADTVITGNWGSDMKLLIKAGTDAGLDVDWFTFYGGGQGAVASIGEAGAGRVKQVSEWHSNIPSDTVEAMTTEYKSRHPETDYYYFRVNNMFGILDQAMKAAGSSEPVQVAKQLHSIEYTTALGGESWMRPDDHQIFQDMYISTLQKDTKFDVDNTGLGFVTDYMIPAADTVLPTSCEMSVPE